MRLHATGSESGYTGAMAFKTRQMLLLLGLLPIAAFLLLQCVDPRLAESIISERIALALSDYSIGFSRCQTPLIFSGITFFSHLEKITPLASGLISLGYPITFVTGSEFQSKIEALGATFERLDGPDSLFLPQDLEEWFAMPPGVDKETFPALKSFIDAIPAQKDTIQRVLKRTRDVYGPQQPLIVISDFSLLGLAPVVYGGPGIRPDAAIGIGLSTLSLESADTMPWNSGLPPSIAPNATAIHAAAQAEDADRPSNIKLNTALKAQLSSLGVKRPVDELPSFGGMMSTMWDHLLPLGVPEFEYPRSDLRANVSYLGFPQAVGIGAEYQRLPDWWDDIAEAKKQGKKIIAVSQGSAYPELNNLIYPTLEALKGREDVLVAASLVVKEPSEVEVIVPENVRVAKFVPFDVLLSQVDVLITAGGFGSVLQALRHGVPMILSGVTQEKPHIGGLVTWTGVGVNLAVDAPGLATIAEAVEKVLGDPSYGIKAREMSRSGRAYNPVRILDGVVRKVVLETR